MSRKPPPKNANNPLTDAVKACGPAFMAIAIISVFINLTMLAMPLYSMQISDRVMTSRNAGTLVMLTIIVVTFLALYGFLEYVRSGIQLRAAILFDDIVRRRLFEALMRTDVTGASKIGPTALRDVEMMREAVSSGLVSQLFDAPWAPIFTLLCFLLHPMLGVVALAGATTMILFTLITEHITSKSVKHTSQLSAEASQFAASALKNGEAVRGLGMGDTIADRWNATQTDLIAAQTVTNEKIAAVTSVSKFVNMLVQAALMGVGAYLALNQEISPGVMMASSIMMGRALSPVQSVVGQWKRIVALRGSYARLKGLYDQLPIDAKGVQPPAPTGHLDVQKVVVVPPTGGRPVVKGVSFSVKPGEVIAVIGSSGSGKSSLARALAGVWPLVQGTVKLDRAEYKAWDPNQLGKHIGYLPQNVELFNGTIAQNIARLAKVDDKAVIAAAKAAGAHELILRLPKGYDTQIGEGGAALSGGTRQRVALARALYGDPRLIILDEPNSNLDDEGDKALHRAVLEMKKAGRTVIVVTHKPQMLSVVDKILVMSFGLTLAFGPRDAVLASLKNPAAAKAAAPGTAAVAGAAKPVVASAVSAAKPAAAPVAARPATAPAAARPLQKATA